MPQLKTIHDSLREQDANGSAGLLRMGPMPQCRYLLALLLMNKAMDGQRRRAATTDASRI